MTIYIATEVNGRGTQLVKAYSDKREYRANVWKWLDLSGKEYVLNKGITIDDLCHSLNDQGPCFGARYHYRISRKEALFLKREGVETYGY